MNIYILRHAIAVPREAEGYKDDDRPLTKEGIKKMEKNAKGIAEIIEDLDVIISSPLVRAFDTAKITAKALRYEKDIITTEYLISGNKPEDLYNYLDSFKNKNNIMLVGHEPHIGYLASDLIGINESVFEFKKGGICLIEIEKLPPEKPGKLVWNLTPKQLRLIAEK
jgi:phosphohistidine phosphatase